VGEWWEDEESPLLPEDVFTPRQAPSREMFTRRNEPDLHGNPGLQAEFATRSASAAGR
jgi:hypothetical protein